MHRAPGTADDKVPMQEAKRLYEALSASCEVGDMIKQFMPDVRWIILVNDVDAPGLQIGPSQGGYICTMCCRSFDQIETGRRLVTEYLQKNRPAGIVTLWIG